MRCLLSVLLFCCFTICADAGANFVSNEAVEKAKEAAFIQSGAAAAVRDLQKFGERKAIHLAASLKIEKVASVGLGVFRVVKTRTIVIPIRQKTLILTPNSVSVEIAL